MTNEEAHRHQLDCTRDDLKKAQERVTRAVDRPRPKTVTRNLLDVQPHPVTPNQAGHVHRDNS